MEALALEQVCSACLYLLPCQGPPRRKAADGSDPVTWFEVFIIHPSQHREAPTHSGKPHVHYQVTRKCQSIPPEQSIS